MNSVELRLDEPTFRKWSKALGNLLVARVVRVHPVDTFPLDPFPPDVIRFTGLELLLQIGRACSRPEVIDDPSRLFALLKYATSLSAGTDLLLPSGGYRSLSLVPDIETLDTHKKAVLSDEFGCGMAFIFSGQVLRTVFYLDVETAIDQGWLRTAASRSRRPDYFALRQFVDPPPWVVLEAKGSQSGDDYCRNNQVPNACSQLEHVDPVGATAIRVAVATSLFRDDQGSPSKVFVGDPEPKGAEPYEFRGDAVGIAIRSHYLRIATLTGDTSLADNLIHGRGKPIDQGTLVRKKIDGRAFVGSEVRFNSGKSSIESFVGLDEDVRGELLRGDFNGFAERLQTDFSKWELGRWSIYEQRLRKSPVIAMAADGTVLMLNRTGPAAEKEW